MEAVHTPCDKSTTHSPGLPNCTDQTPGVDTVLTDVSRKEKTLPFATIRFALSSLLSLLGNSVAGVIIPLVLLARTGDALAAGTLALICAIPQMVVGLVGGALLDRINRRDVSIISDFISALSVALLPIVDMIWGLNFTWFVVLGLLGAIGDIPGMTARDTLVPEVVKHDHIDLQRYLGVTQSLESLVTIIGPALAALLISFGTDSSALWVTAGLSTLAALVTLTLPRSLGAIPQHNEIAQPAKSLITLVKSSFIDGWRTLFTENALLRTSVLLGLGIIMVLGSFQGLVLPVHFTAVNEPAHLGYILSTMAGGLLVGSLVYTALAGRLRKRTWMVISLIGMAIAVVALSMLPAFPIMLGVAAFLGFCAGPASALMGFIVYDCLPADRRGTALGTQNAIILVAAPLAVFAISTVVESLGVGAGARILGGCWILVTLFSLTSRGLKELR